MKSKQEAKDIAQQHQLWLKQQMELFNLIDFEYLNQLLSESGEEIEEEFEGRRYAKLEQKLDALTQKVDEL